MPIVASNIKLLASQRMTDTEDGGGQMTGTGLQDGADNNVFPDISSTDRAFGRLALRKVWPSVQSSGTDTLLGGHVILDDVPDDANVLSWAVLGNGAGEDRADVIARLQASHWSAGPTGLIWAGSPRRGTRIQSVGGVLPLAAGSIVMADGASDLTPVRILTATVISDGTKAEGFSVAPGAGDVVYEVTYDDPAIVVTPGNTTLAVPSPASPRVITTRPVTGTLAAGDTFCIVDTLNAQIVPKQPGVAPGSSAQVGIDGNAVPAGGTAAAFRRGDGLVIHHTAEVAAATYSNGNTVNVGRTNVKFRVIGADGRGMLTGWTGNEATGVLTVTDITGWAQPVRVRHTIEDVLACARTSLPERSGGSAGSSTTTATSPFVLSNGLTMYCGRPNVGSIRVISKTGQDITDQTEGTGLGAYFRVFGIDLAAGTVTYGGSYAPFITSHSPVTLISSGSYTATGAPSAPLSTANRINFNRPLTRAFPAGTLISSMLFLGDLQALAGQAFSQESWTSVWADSRIGSAIAPQYQQSLNPIVVSNQGAISERWAIIFTTSTQFRLIGETLGQIATGDVNSTFTPNNPATGTPYFTIASTGWGAGWAAGNVLRFNTVGANAPVWVGRAVLPSAPSSTPDSLSVAVRGDLDA